MKRETPHEAPREPSSVQSCEPPAELQPAFDPTTTTDLDPESPQIVESAMAIGERRLHRLTFAHAVTALIGGLAVSFGSVAMAWTAGPWLSVLGYERAHWLGALAFPIGFVILIIGKGELFTENFFVPVTGVMGRRGTVAELLLLWASTLLFNLIGSLIFALLVSRKGVLSADAARFAVELARGKVTLAFGPSFMKGIFAGWLMTILTWLLLALRGQGSRLFVIYSIGFFISACDFNHVVISAAEVFTAMALGESIGVSGWFARNFVPALLGNLVGGLVFVTVLGYVQAHSLRRSDRKQQEHRAGRDHV